MCFSTRILIPIDSHCRSFEIRFENPCTVFSFLQVKKVRGMIIRSP